MARWLAEHELVPELILSSSSARTRETVELMLDTWPTPPKVVYSQNLYLASAEALLWTTRSEHANAASVLLLAHNPGIAMLASTLSGAMLPMPTAALAIFKVNGEADESPLAELNKRTRVELEHYVTPKSLADDHT